MPNSLARRSQSSAKVRSGCLAIQSRMSPSTGAMRETRLPPCARLLVLPLSSKTLLHQVDPGTAHLKSLGYINWSITTFQCPNHSISQILGIALHRTSPSQSTPKCHYSDQIPLSSYTHPLRKNPKRLLLHLRPRCRHCCRIQGAFLWLCLESASGRTFLNQQKTFTTSTTTHSIVINGNTYQSHQQQPSIFTSLKARKLLDVVFATYTNTTKDAYK